MLAGSGWRRFLFRCGIASALLLIANAIVAISDVGSRAGQTYDWACQDCGAKLFYAPTLFVERTRFVPGHVGPDCGHRWELVSVGSPRPSPWLPWNWLALLLAEPIPAPQAIIKREKIKTD